MDIVLAHKYFDLITDKVGSPYFTSDEKDLFIQRGQVDYVNQFFDNVTNKYNAEQHSYDIERIYPLIYEVEVMSDQDGKLYYEDINAQLPNQSFMYVLGVRQQANPSASCKTTTGDYAFSQFVRHNDLGPRLQLSLKRPTSTKPIHVYFSDYLQLYPNSEKKIKITVVKEPIKVTLDDPDDLGEPGPDMVDFDLPQSVLNNVLLLALKNAGISIRDTEFFQLVNAQQDKTT